MSDDADDIVTLAESEDDFEVIEVAPAGEPAVRMGRPAKLTPERHEAALEAIRVGGTREAAAKRAGVPRRTLERWLAAGRRSKREPYFSFFAAVQQAESDAYLLAVRTVSNAMVGGQLLSRESMTRADGTEVVRETYARPEWTAGAWYLERRYPHEWGRIERIEIDVKSRIQALAEELGLPYDVVLAEAQRQAMANVTTTPGMLPASRRG